jgi:hypothetical protein
MRLYSAPYMEYRVGVRLLFSVSYPTPIFFACTIHIRTNNAVRKFSRKFLGFKIDPKY